eukprot:4737809-Alexandrium_andersonii.AAC.1
MPSIPATDGLPSPRSRMGGARPHPRRVSRKAAHRGEEDVLQGAVGAREEAKQDAVEQHVAGRKL